MLPHPTMLTNAKLARVASSLPHLHPVVLRVSRVHMQSVPRHAKLVDQGHMLAHKLQLRVKVTKHALRDSISVQTVQPAPTKNVAIVLRTVSL